MNGASTNPSVRPDAGITLGLRENWQQFSLLVLINAFVGGMVGLERTVVPLIGSEEFKIASTTIVVSFIVSFGVVKALANLVSGHFADVYGRKAMLVLGWLVGLPVPFMIGWGPSWAWIVAANALLGINQGFAWSMTVIMKVDLVGPEVARPGGRAQRIRRLSLGRRDRLSHRLHRSALWATPGAFLSRHRLCGAGLSAFDPAWCATRAIMSDWKSHVTPRAPRRLASGRSSGTPRSATAICSPPRKPAWSIISMTV